MVHIVDGGGSDRVESAKFVERSDLLFDGGRNLVLCKQFADGSLYAFGTRSVVTPDVNHQRVVSQAALLQSFDDAQDLMVGVLDEARVDFHQSTLERTL